MAQLPTFPAGQDRRQPTAPILRIENLGVAFGGMQVIDDLSLSVEKGQIVSLIGPNGAGKTTVLNCISGFVRPQRGSITYDGRDLVPLPPHARAGLGVSRTFQNLQLFASMTVLDNLLVALHTRIRTGLLRDLLWIPAQAEERRAVRHARTILDRLGLRESERVPAGTLSFGQQKLLGVARCLALGGRLLLLDEPAAGLNRQEARALAAFIRSLPSWSGGKHTAVLVVEHNMDLVMRISDRVVVLHHGGELASGTPEDVRRTPAVIEAYLGKGPADE